MNKLQKIKIRLSLTITKHDLALLPIFNDLARIEANEEKLTDFEIQSQKRTYLLSILYQFAASNATPAVNFEKRVANHSNDFNCNEVKINAKDPPNQASNRNLTANDANNALREAGFEPTIFQPNKKEIK